MMTFAKAVTSGYLPLGGVVVGPRLRGWLEADEAFLLTHGGTYSVIPAAARPGWRTSRSCSASSCPSVPGRPAGGSAPASISCRGSRRRRRGARRGTDAGGRARAAGRRSGRRPRRCSRTASSAARLPYANAVAFSPPLIISDDEVDELVGGHAPRRSGRWQPPSEMDGQRPSSARAGRCAAGDRQRRRPGLRGDPRPDNARIAGARDADPSGGAGRRCSESRARRCARRCAGWRPRVWWRCAPTAAPASPTSASATCTPPTRRGS